MQILDGYSYGEVSKNDGYLLAKYAEQVKFTGLHCPHCSMEPSLYQVRVLTSTFRSITCRDCEKEYNCFSVKAVITEDNPSFPLTQSPKEVFNTTWFHATPSEHVLSNRKPWHHWLSTQNNDRSIHMGTQAAALDRGTAKYKYFETYDLYELEIAPVATVATLVRKDTNTINVGSHTTDVIRYINKWEDPTSISLAVRKKFIRVKGVVTLDAAGMAKRLSIFNLGPIKEMNQTQEEQEDWARRQALKRTWAG